MRSVVLKIIRLAGKLTSWIPWQQYYALGSYGGLTTFERQRQKELEQRNRELRRSNDILRQASLALSGNYCQSDADSEDRVRMFPLFVRLFSVTTHKWI